jgi:hypothetical protein
MLIISTVPPCTLTAARWTTNYWGNLFEGTAKENIVFNKRGVTDEEVVYVCKAISGILALSYFRNSVSN